jgi:phosphotransferase system IIB component
MMILMIYLSSTTVQTYIFIAVGIILLLSLIFIFLKLTRKKGNIIPVDETFLSNIYMALGKKQNIKSLEMKQQRLQIEVANIKDIDQVLLKETNTPAFLTGKKITLLIKNNTKEVFNYLNEKRKEEQ